MTNKIVFVPNDLTEKTLKIQKLEGLALAIMDLQKKLSVLGKEFDEAQLELDELESPISVAFRGSGQDGASWYIVPRVILEAMPREWQMRFISIVTELESSYDWISELTEPVFVAQFHGDDIVNPPAKLVNYETPDLDWLKSISK